MTNQFNNKGSGDQNNAFGDRPIGKQVNYYNTAPPPPPPRQLPHLDPCFLGRDKELAELVEQLHPGKVAAVCGPGGMGKSALAAQAVHKLAELEENRFPDGIVFHSFYDKSSMEEALQTIAEAFQVEAQVGLATAVQTVLAGKKALLILDGTEEAEDLKAVLDLRSTCGVLITSRKRSDALAPPLKIKPLKEQASAEVFRFYSGAPKDDESVQGICTILDGWPVGLRIAGRYLSSTGESATDYLRWLEQEPFKELGDGERQEENAALLLRRSVAQVSKDARLVLAMAGILAFAPIARKPVSAILDGDDRRTRTTLNQLVNYGLMEKREERWQVSHALIHTYTRTDLVLSKESLERLAGYYIDFCETQSVAGLKGYTHLDRERAHCLRLMETCLASKLWQEVSRLAEAMWDYFDRQGHWTEQLAACEMRLNAARKAEDRRDEAVSLSNLGCTCWRCGEYEHALQWYEQCIPIWDEMDDPQGESTTLTGIGSTYWAQGSHEQALYYYEQSLTLFRKIGDRKGEGTTLNNLGTVYKSKDEDKQALAYYQQCLLIWKELGNKRGQATALDNIATIYHVQDNTTKAIEYRKQALAICHEIGDRAGEAVICWNFGTTYYRDDLARAEECISRAVQIAEAIGHPLLADWRDFLERVRAEMQGR